jgi:hypothetical protein
MLQAILTILFAHPDFSKYKQIQIDDNSHIYIKSHKNGKYYETRLMDMYFLSTGCTWYSSLAPMFLSKVQDDKEYQTERAHMMNISWEEFTRNLPVQLDMEATKEELAYKVLNRIRKERHQSIVFYDYMNQMLRAMGISSMYGKMWTIPLKTGKVVFPTSDSQDIGCVNEGGWAIPEPYRIHVSGDEFKKIKEELQIPEGIPIKNWPSNIPIGHRYYMPSVEPNMENLNEINNNSMPDNINSLLMRF